MGIHVIQRQLFGHSTLRASERITVSNNTITGPLYGVLTDLVKTISLDKNTITNSPVNALYMRGVPASSTYSITDNDLSNAGDTSLIIGKVQDPGVKLTLTGNTFDGSRNGASLNNILGPFTLSPADNNTFAGAGTGGTTLLISGLDLTVDGFSFGFGALDGGTGIFVNDRFRFGHSNPAPSERITISNTSVTGFTWGILTGLHKPSPDNKLLLDKVTACGNTSGIGIRGNGVDVLSGNVGGNFVEGIHVFNPSTNVVIDGVNFFGNPVGKDVVDDTGAATVLNSTSISFNCPAPGANEPPTADAGPDQIVEWTGGAVSLNGGGSSDDDGDPLTYSWVFTSKPLGSTASLTGTNTATPSFTPDLLGDYVVELVVNDGTVDSDPDTVTITVRDTTAPTVTAALVPVVGDDDDHDDGLFRVEFSCSDSCDTNPAVTATLNGILVSNGQIVSLQLDDDGGQEVKWEDGILEIQAASF